MAVIDKRKTKEGEITYRVRVRIKGRPPQVATFKRITDAKKWAQQTETEIYQGRYFKNLEGRKRTLSEAVDRYIEKVLPRKPKSYKKFYMQLNWWKSKIGCYFLSDITPSLIVEFRDELSDGITFRGDQRTPATVNRYLAALSHLFSIAVKEWEWIENNPLNKVSKLKEPRGRDRYLLEDERQRLLKACQESDSPYLYLAVILAISTGGRRSEIFGLRWEKIDFERKVVIVNETKNEEPRTLTLSGYAFDLIRAYAELCHFPKTGWLFPSEKVDKPIDLRKSWYKVKKQAEVSNFYFHDLRHTAASYLAMNNATAPQLMEILGHKSLQMVMRYAHLSKSHVSGVVADMNEKIFDTAK